MVRHYRRTTDRPGADRHITLRVQRRAQIDVEKIAEVLIRHALRSARNDPATVQAGEHLRQLLNRAG